MKLYRWIALAGGLGLVAWGQAVLADSPGVLHPVYMRFLDSKTGAAVKPTAVELDQQPITSEATSEGLLELNAMAGQHKLTIHADNYQPMTLPITVEAGNTPVQEVELDPVPGAEEAPVPEGIAILQGTVVDNDSGALLAGVRITLPDTGFTTGTTSGGAYELSIAVPASRPGFRPVTAVNFAHDGYTPLQMKNIEIVEGERRIMPVRLDKATSDSVEAATIDEARPQGPVRNYDWVFDVSVR